MPEELETEVIDSPASEAVSAETVIAEEEVGGPITPEEDVEISALQAAVDTATSEEEKQEAISKRNKAFARIRTEKKEAEKSAQQEREDKAYWKGKAEALEQRTAPAAAPAQIEEAGPELPAKPDKSKFTDEEGYEDQEAYFEAVADWKAECKFIQRDYTTKQAEARKNQEKAAEDQRAWESAGETKFPGFKEKVVGRLRPVLMGVHPQKANDFSVAISESDKSHELAFYLAGHPEDLSRLLGLTVPSMLREIGKLEDRLEKPPAQTTTKAPSPIKPVKTGGEAPTNLMDIEDDNEYFSQVKKRGRPY